MDNDAIHKFAYRHLEMVADLLRLAVPALAAELDLAAAKEVSPAQLGRTPTGIEQRLRTEWARFSGTGNDAMRRILHTWAHALVADIDEDGTVLTLPSFEELAGRKEEEMTTIAQADLREWRRNHGERHAARAARQERKRAAAMMLRQAAIKFGAPTADRLTAILGTAPTAERMDQVGVAIMECGSGAELLARCSGAGE